MLRRQVALTPRALVLERVREARCRVHRFVPTILLVRLHGAPLVTWDIGGLHEMLICCAPTGRPHSLQHAWHRPLAPLVARQVQEIVSTEPTDFVESRRLRLHALRACRRWELEQRVLLLERIQVVHDCFHTAGIPRADSNRTEDGSQSFTSHILQRGLDGGSRVPRSSALLGGPACATAQASGNRLHIQILLTRHLTAAGLVFLTFGTRQVYSTRKFAHVTRALLDSCGLLARVNKQGACTTFVLVRAIASIVVRDGTVTIDARDLLMVFVAQFHSGRMPRTLNLTTALHQVSILEVVLLLLLFLSGTHYLHATCLTPAIRHTR